MNLAGWRMPKLAELIQVLSQDNLCVSHNVSSELSFDTLCTDTRTLVSGNVFVALEGPHFDGSKFLAAAKEKGAVAAIIRQGAVGLASAPLGCIEVTDPLQALQHWARHWRRQWQGSLIAVTGSNGKTTVKQMIAAVLAQAYGTDHAWATPGNLNNHIGVPLSVLGLLPQHRAAVLELGMNHPNEIAGLAAIALPHIGLVNNAQREHQEFMKTVAAVAQENGQVFAALPASGVAVFPKDPAHEPIWRKLADTRRCIRFGFETAGAAPGFRGDEVLGRWTQGNTLAMRFACGDLITVELQGAGEHFALNALAAAACCWAAGIDLQTIAKALSGFAPVAGRGKKLGLAGGGILVDDTYNANPDSVRAAIDALLTLPSPHALVLGDMGEVGDQGEQFHCEVLRYADQKNIAAMWLHGQAMAQAHSHTGLGKHFDQVDGLVSDLRGWLGQQQRQAKQPSVWAKGSRFMKMERVVEQLKAPLQETAA